MIVPVTYRPSVFSGAVERYRLPQGLSLAEIAAAIPGLPVAFWEYGVIEVGGIRFDRESWGHIRPRHREGHEIAVTLAMVPAGGNILQIVAQAALTGLTAIAGAASPLLGALVGIGGNFLLQLLFPPEKPDEKRPRDAVSYGVSSNPARPLEQLQRVLGTLEYSPPYLANPYSSMDEQDVYVEAVVGLAGNHSVTNIKLNGTDIDDNESVDSYEVREGTGSEADITIGAYNAFEERPSTQLSRWLLSTVDNDEQELRDQGNPSRCDPQWHSFSSRGTCDELSIRLLFSSGLMLTESDGNTTPASVPIRLQLRKRGDASWINGPEFHFRDKDEIAQEMRQEIRLKWQAGGSIAAVNLEYAASNAFWNASPGETYEWEADTYFNPGTGSLYSDHVEQVRTGFNVYLNPSNFPQGEYEVRLMRGRAYVSNEFYHPTYLYSGNVLGASFFHYYDSGGLWIVAEAQNRFTDACSVDAITSLSYEYPLPAQADVPLTLIAVKVKNATINSISATFTSRVGTWNGANWNTLATSQNPAALYRHVLADTVLNAKPLPSTIIDDDALSDWYDACVTAGYECNMVAAEGVLDTLKLIAVAGWAAPRQNEKFGIMREYDRSAESIVQNFTPLNSRGFTVRKPFTDIPHGVYAEFVDETSEYRLRNRTIYRDGYTSANATLFQAIRYDSITDPSQIDARALMDLRQMVYRQTTTEIEVGAESLMSGRGDLVGLTHDVVGKKYFYGLVAAVLTSGGNVTGLRLDATAELSAVGGPCGAMVRYEDGTILEAQINEQSDTNQITFTTPFTIPSGGVLAPDCLVAIGAYGLEFKRMLIANIQPSGDWSAKLSLVAEAPEIHLSEDALAFDADYDNSTGYIGQF